VGEITKVLPIALLIEGRRCLVVGGGPVGTRKVRDLIDAGAEVVVVSPEISEELTQLLDAHIRVSWRRGTFHASDLDGVALVITATGVRDVDSEVFATANARGLLVNSADDPLRCNFFLTALVRRDPVVVSVTTAGTSPALAAYLKRRLNAQLEDELGKLAELLGNVRRDLLGAHISTEALPWASAITDQLVDLCVAGEWDEARRTVMETLGVSL
jgi:precorrin-2 dehydrogenase/sirohydrochlorin ferrochelatase